MFKKIRQYNYIRKIRKEMSKSSLLKFLTLNAYKTSAAHDLLHNKITEKFYCEIFLGGNISAHYTEVNKEKIENYSFWN